MKDERTAPADLDPGEARDLCEIFAVLADVTRVRIAYTILRAERSVGEIATRLQLSEPTVSQHLRRLKVLRVVRMRQAGRHRFYVLDDDHVETLLAVCLEHVRGG
mgnify:CR=1 FL=1